MKTIIRIILSAIFLIVSSNSALSQKIKSYDYLIGCFKNTVSETESGSEEIEIDKIGTVKPISLSASESEETGLFYYDVPKKKLSLSTAKLAELATNFHIQTWKNNSKIISSRQQKNGAVSIVDLRMHMIIEDIYMQVITISETGKIYQVICYRDADNYQGYFDSLFDKVIKQTCF